MSGTERTPAAPADPSIEQAIDREALGEQFAGDLDLLREVVARYRPQREQLIARLGQGIDSGDTAELASTAHTLCGSLLVLNAVPAIVAVRAFEAAAKAGDRGEMKRCFPTLEERLHRLDSALEAILQRGFDGGSP